MNLEYVMYWYARGYFDGRTNGEDLCPSNISEFEASAYKSGYETGVADWEELDNTGVRDEM